MSASQKSENISDSVTTTGLTPIVVENSMLMSSGLSTNQTEEVLKLSENHPSTSNSLRGREMPIHEGIEPSERASEVKEMRGSLSRVTNMYCLLIVVGVLAATTITFCTTRNPFSFTILTTLAYIHRLRQREESYLYPLSERDFLLELTKIKKYSSGTNHTKLTWVQRLFRKLPE